MIRRRRPERYETKTGHERWLVSYSDFITLLFGFFVVMYSVSQVSEQKYRALSNTLASVFDGNVPVEMQTDELLDQYPLDDRGKISGLSPQINLIDTKVLAKELEEVLVHLVEPKDITISATEDWVQIDVNANLLFASASATPSTEARRIFEQVAKVLAPYDNEVEVAGHTDNVPIATDRFASNWELSASRAASVVRLLSDDGVAAARLSAVGYGEFRPLASNQTVADRAKNRRVVLQVARHQVKSDFAPPLAPPGPLPTVIDAANSAQQASSSASEVAPVRLQNGGLLFSSDPDAPRQ